VEGEGKAPVVIVLRPYDLLPKLELPQFELPKLELPEVGAVLDGGFPM
jgi:hypothetical protein